MYEHQPPLAAYAVASAPATPRGRLTLDVLGGIVFAIFVSMTFVKLSFAFPQGAGWAGAIAWETVWVAAAMVASTLLPSAIEHTSDWRSTLHGIGLDWPEALMSAWLLYRVLNEIGVPHGVLGPLGFALAVGAAEEFIFRVALLGWLVSKVETVPALAISAAVFGIAHLNELSLLGIANILPQTASGFLLGAVYLRTRNIVPCIVLHAFWDFPIFLAWGLVSGGSTEAGYPPMLDVAKWTVLAVYGLYLVRTGVPAAGRTEPVRYAA